MESNIKTTIRIIIKIRMKQVLHTPPRIWCAIVAERKGTRVLIVHRRTRYTRVNGPSERQSNTYNQLKELRKMMKIQKPQQVQPTKNQDKDGVDFKQHFTTEKINKC